jgi:non-specific serine/threonine protein kinase/serine/threonine-protein kinase
MIDGGLLADGQPYMVMEYVDGMPIHQWCAQHQASPRQCVALILQACEEVAHAHARLVVHRDLKPSNLLVDTDGRVRLIDFGVADLADTGDNEIGRAPLSLGYAAPEQLDASAQVGVAADIHAMAAVLYRLLAGHAPHAHDDPPTALLATRSIGQPAPRLRDAATARAALDGDRALLLDLDAVIAAALQPDPAQRPRSMDAFAEELRRARAGRPVHARDGEPRYRLGRFLHAQRWALAGIAAVVSALAIGLGLALAQTHEAERQRDVAVREKTRLEAVQQAVFLMFRDAGELHGADATAGEVLQHSAQRVVDEFARDPAQGALLHTLGELYFLLNDYAAAEPLLQQLANADPARVDPSWIADGRHDLAQIAVRNGDLSRAAYLLAQAQAFWRTDPAHWQRPLLASRLLEAQVRQRQGDADGAVALLRRALAEQVARHGAHDRETGVFQNNLGVALFGLGRHDEARSAFRAATEVWRRNRLEDTPDALNTLNNWGSIELASGAIEAAEPLLRRALDLRRRLYGPSAATAALLNNYGKLQLQSGHVGEAVMLLAEAAEMGARFAGVGSMHHVAALSGLADAQLLAGDLAQAERLARQAIAAADQHLGRDHPGTASPRLSLARVHAARGERTQALTLLAAVDTLAAKAGPAGQRLLTQSAELRERLSPMLAATTGTTTPAP